MKKTVWMILFCLCLLLTAGALAEETRLTCPDLQPAQVNPSVPAGSFTLDSNNHLYLNINTKATNWNKLITLAGLPSDNLTLRFSLTKPEGADRCAIESGTDTYFNPDWFRSYGDCDPIYGNSVSFRIPYARYLRDTEMVTFTPEPNLALFAIRWYKADQSVLMDEYYYIHLPSGSVRVHPDYPAAIVPEKRDGLQTFLSYAGVKYRVFRGSLSELTTLVKAPAGAAQFAYDGGTQSVQNGYAKLTSDARVTNTQHYAITWQDQSGREISTEALYISVNVYSSKPAVAERDDLNPLINGNQGWMGINAVARQVMTAQIGYKGVNGWMNIRMQGGPRMVWEDLQESRYVLRLKVPDGAKSLFVTELSEDIYEPLDDQQIQGMMHEFSQRPNEGFDLVSGPEYIYQEGLLKNMTPGDPRIAVYAPYLPQDDDIGMVRLFFWYDADGDLTSLYWALITTSDVGTFVTRPFHREADIRDRVEQPCFVDDRHDDWQLQSHYNPQSGNNAYQVELTLLDDSGLDVQPNGSTVFYLPYPDGMSYQNGATWTLRHYLDDGYETYETIQVTSTEYGLRFESSSLSPFVLLWDGGTEPQPAAAPKTGDSSPLALYAALTALSAALMVLLAARRKKA